MIKQLVATMFLAIAIFWYIVPYNAAKWFGQFEVFVL
jgi:hypothetical protein